MCRLTLAVCALVATGCTSWQAQAGTVQQALAPSPEAPVDSERVARLTTPSGKIELSNPQVLNDSVYGHEPSRGYVGFPSNQVQLVEFRQPNTLGTTVVVVGLAASAVATVVALRTINQLCHDYEG